MHSTVRVAVIGGGTFSYSTLYKPTNKDWSNLVQLEWAKLLFVYLWHAMGGWVNTLDSYTTRPQTRNFTLRSCTKFERITAISFVMQYHANKIMRQHYLARLAATSLHDADCGHV